MSGTQTKDQHLQPWRPPDFDRYSETAFSRATSAVANCVKGDRHNTLNREAYGLGRLVGAGRMSRSEVVEAMVAAAEACGLVGGRASPSWSTKHQAGAAIERMVDDGAANPSPAPMTHRRYRGTTAPRYPPRGTPEAENPLRLEPPGVSGEAIELATRIDEAIEPLTPTPAAIKWLKDRGLDVRSAWSAGCRDWNPAVDRLRTILREASETALKEMGLLSATGTDWWPLAALLRGNTRTRGLFIPCRARPGKLPLRYRWRYYEPTAKTPKSLSAHGRGLPLLTEGDPSNVIVCEGEPDWLSCAEVVGEEAIVVGLVAVAAGLPMWLEPLLRDAKRVVVATHNAAGGRSAAEQIATRLVELVGPEAADERYIRLEVEEDDDCNDHHRRKELAPQLLCALETRGRG